jgi:hypothetical protein
MAEDRSTISIPESLSKSADFNRAEQRVADSLDSMATRGVRRVVLWGNTAITDLVTRLISENGRHICRRGAGGNRSLAIGVSGF